MKNLGVLFGFMMLWQTTVTSSLNVLGIFTICENHPDLKNNFTRQGAIYHQAILVFYEYTSIDYSVVDVCYNETVLLNFLIDKVLANTSYLEIGNDSTPYKHV
eukprot:TCONS_00052400-protein